MRRRELIAGAVGLGVFGVGAATVYSDFDIPLDDEEATEEFEPVTIPRLDAPGSPPGEEQVPEPGRVSFVELFATWCSICKANMEPLAEAASQAGDVQFVSITNEPVGQTVEKEDVVDWWEEHGGNWHLAHDADLDVTRKLDASEVPYAVVFDESNRLVWESRGYKTTEEILDAIEEAY